MKKIAIVTSGHFTKDDRLYYKFARSLQKKGHTVVLISSLENLFSQNGEIILDSFDSSGFGRKKKSEEFFLKLQKYSPDAVICSEPFTVFPAYRYKRDENRNARIIMDVTEWYPENITMKLKGLKKIFGYLALSLVNFAATYRADVLTIGESSKAVRYKFFRPGIKYKIFGYYPPLELLTDPGKNETGTITVLYSGHFAEARGFFRYLEVIKEYKYRFGEDVKFKAIGKFLNAADERKYNHFISQNTEAVPDIIPWSDYEGYFNALKNSDICIDLRDKNNFFNRSVPIKIFDYIGSGNPFIFSDLKAVTEISELSGCGIYCEPENRDKIIGHLHNLVTDKRLFSQYRNHNLEMARTKFNWNNVEEEFVSFVLED